ncbi:DNA mismatch repair protein msh6 [Batrachochytrium dendrobatidis]|nr:DNA mismatch repair protein msh6 [Batrachochytrium dendrobatidis]
MSNKENRLASNSMTPTRKPSESFGKNNGTSRSGSAKQPSKQMTLMSFLTPKPSTASVHTPIVEPSKPLFLAELTESDHQSCSTHQFTSEKPKAWPPRAVSSVSLASQSSNSSVLDHLSSVSPLHSKTQNLIGSQLLGSHNSICQSDTASNELSDTLMPSKLNAENASSVTSPLSNSLGLKRPRSGSAANSYIEQDSDEDIPLLKLRAKNRQTIIEKDDDYSDTPSCMLNPNEMTKSKVASSPINLQAYTPTKSCSSTPKNSDTTTRWDMSPSLSNTTPSPSRHGSRLASLTNSDRKKERIAQFKDKNELRYSWLQDIKDANKNAPDDPNYDPRTLYIPPSAWANFTPFEKQFWEIKAAHWDTVVFFKKGKFYELYEKDADIGHQKFDLKRTDRVNMRMVGVPESSFDHWAAQFIAKGFKVAKVEQMENSIGKAIRDRESSKKEDKIIRRELTSVLTAGTLVDAGLLTNDLNTYCMAIKEEVSAEHLPPTFGVCFVDTASAEFNICTFEDDVDRTKFTTLIMQVKPTELVLEKSMLSKATMRILKNSLENPIFNFLLRDKEFWDEEVTMDELNRGGYFKDMASTLPNESSSTVDSSWPQALRESINHSIAMSAFGGLLFYLRSLKLDTSLVSAKNFHLYDPIKSSGTLILDGQTLVNLELFENSSDGSDRGTLFKLLNQCVTPFGKRLFKLWLCHPLQSIDLLNSRLDAIDDFTSMVGLLDTVRSNISKLPDLERIVARIHTKSCHIKDFILALAAFDRVFTVMTECQSYIGKLQSALLKPLFSEILNPELMELIQYFKVAFNHQDAFDEGKIRLHSGYDDVFDSADKNVVAIEKKLDVYRRECEKKLGYNGITFKNIGKEIFQMEIPTKIKVPSDWTVMSNTKAVNRYYTTKSREMINEMLEAQEIREEAMRQIKTRVFEKFDTQYKGWIKVVRDLSVFDCLMSLTICRQSMSEPICRPEFVNKGPSVLELKELRHPCIIQSIGDNFIANDTCLGGDSGNATMILLTGPNMGGKSTLLRQTCIAVIMAQLGCYVPAAKCRLTPFDRIFTRIGASDNIMAGQSTFMVELTETSKILREATPRSLVILDELGRGTSTYDGYAIAYAVLNHLITNVRSLGLFSTHYGTLTNEFHNHPLIKMMHMSFFADQVNKQVTFLYKLEHGNCPKSYGMNVASLANVPKKIVDRAEDVAKSFEERQVCHQSSQQAHQFSLGSLITFAKLVEYAKKPSLSVTDKAILAAHLQELTRF